MRNPPAFVDVLLVGCGYLGRRAAHRWILQGKSVAALTRSHGQDLAAAGIAPILGDVCDAASLVSLPAAKTVLYAVGLDRSAGRSMREVYVAGLANVLKALPNCERFIYVSSTSVYGQTHGEWVDESSPTTPLEESGRVVLDAEAALMSPRPDAIRLRFAGIYGPGRLLRKQAILKGEPLGGDASKWLNLIHVEDGAAAILAAEANAAPGDLVNVADDDPARRRDFYTLLAELLNAPAARFDDSPMPTGRDTHRRIRNDRAKKIGFNPQFPSYRQGLPAAVAAESLPAS